MGATPSKPEFEQSNLKHKQQNRFQPIQGNGLIIDDESRDARTERPFSPFEPGSAIIMDSGNGSPRF